MNPTLLFTTPHRSWNRFRGGAVLALMIIAGLAGLAPAKAAPVLTRAQAVAALLAPGSGVAINTNLSPTWLPTVNMGFGAGFEGVLPAGTTVANKVHSNANLDFGLSGSHGFLWMIPATACCTLLATSSHSPKYRSASPSSV